MLPHSRYLGLERTLGPVLTPLVSELRMIDLVTFIDHVVNGREATIAEIVETAAELHFTPGFIAYEGYAEVRADWSGAPSVSLGVRLTSACCVARARVTMWPKGATIELQDISTEGCDDRDDGALLRDALIRNAVPTGRSGDAPRP